MYTYTYTHIHIHIYIYILIYIGDISEGIYNTSNIRLTPDDVYMLDKLKKLDEETETTENTETTNKNTNKNKYIVVLNKCENKPEIDTKFLLSKITSLVSDFGGEPGSRSGLNVIDKVRVSAEHFININTLKQYLYSHAVANNTLFDVKLKDDDDSQVCMYVCRCIIYI